MTIHPGFSEAAVLALIQRREQVSALEPGACPPASTSPAPQATRTQRGFGAPLTLMSQVRSLLLERGHVVAQGRAQLAATLANLLDGEQAIFRADLFLSKEGYAPGDSLNHV